MSYCVNCGNNYSLVSGICSACYSDQRIPNRIIEDKLKHIKTNRDQEHIPLFGYPGEKAALVLSLIISVIIAIILGTISIGIFIALLAINLIYLKMSHISNKKNMIQVSEHNFAKVLTIAKVGAYRLSLPLPEIYVTESSDYNAYTMGFSKYGFIVLNSALIKDFQPEELLFIIGHEMGHMKKLHTTWLSLLNPSKQSSAQFVLSPIINVIFNVWSIKAEYTADQGGLIACKNVGAAINSFVKLAGGNFAKEEIDIKNLLDQNNEKEEFISNILEFFNTHPFIQNRIKQINIFNKSQQGG